MRRTLFGLSALVVATLLGAHLSACGSGSSGNAPDDGSGNVDTGAGGTAGSEGTTSGGGGSSGSDVVGGNGGSASGSAKPGGGGSSNAGGGPSGPSQWVKDGKPGSYANCADATVASRAPRASAAPP